MSKVKIQGHASGTGVFTLTSPNSSTDRTITLPDGTGTLAFTTGDDDKLPLAGGTMTGQLNLNSHLDMGDNHYIALGDSDDFQIYHDGSNSYIKDTGTGNLIIRGSNNLKLQSATGEDMVVATTNDAVGLYFDNTLKIATTNAGATITGDLIVTDTANTKTSIAIHDHDTSGYVGAEANALWIGRDSAVASANNLGIYADGRGLSRFTAKAWAIFSTVGTPGYWGSNYHNTSSFVDHGTGDITLNFTNAMGSTQFAVVGSGGNSTTDPSDKNIATVPVNSTSCRIEIYNVANTGAGVLCDLNYVSIIVFAV